MRLSWEAQQASSLQEQVVLMPAMSFCIPAAHLEFPGNSQLKNPELLEKAGKNLRLFA
jgi:hypothetical protein